MAFRLIPAGTFRMGSRAESHDEEPIHLVRITRDFWMAETPVTQKQFALWTGSPDYRTWRAARGQSEEHTNEFEYRPNHPAERMTWDEAVGYCEWLMRQPGIDLPTGFTAGLPSEAQWEYACRAGTETEYWSGDGEAALAEVGWYDGNSGNQTHVVGEKGAPNPWGLHDMHGNVSEWCRDAWVVDAYRRERRVDGSADPETTAADAGERNPDRVIRGGSWIYSARACLSAIRVGRWPVIPGRNQGFRCCLFPGPVAQAQKSQRAEAEPAA
ncbi:MAG: formylglycine-generating enzyme family protein [Phycisphaerales bacterium]|jgi:formylglycine-generating enzyme required for sulfatase activity